MINRQALEEAHQAAEAIHAANDARDEIDWKAAIATLADEGYELTECGRARADRLARGISYWNGKAAAAIELLNRA